MFGFKSNKKKVFNPLGITKDSMLEFQPGAPVEGNLYFKKVVEIVFPNRSIARYLMYSMSEDCELILEVFPQNNGQYEYYLYKLVETIPFSEDFLELVGQKYITNPDGVEFQRSAMSNNPGRVDGLKSKIMVFNLVTEEFEREVEVSIWDYQREDEQDNYTEFLNIEMTKDNGMFRIFSGIQLEEIYFRIYNTETNV